jgi:hypothetical protein
MEAKDPREGCAALVLGHYHQRRAGVARIGQTWLPNRQDTSARPGVTPACVACKSKVRVASPGRAVGVFTIHANLGYVRPESERSSCIEQQSEQQRRWTDPDDGRLIQQRKPAHTDWPDRLGRSQRWPRLSFNPRVHCRAARRTLGTLWDHTLCI